MASIIVSPFSYRHHADAGRRSWLMNSVDFCTVFEFVKLGLGELSLGDLNGVA
jgi:hypothetical protein